MTRPPSSKTVIIVVAGTIAGWALLAILADEASLGAADMAASVISMLVGIAALMFSVANSPNRPPASPADPAAVPVLGTPRTRMIIGLAVAAISIAVVIIVVSVAGDDPTGDRDGAVVTSSPSAAVPVTEQPTTSSDAPSPEACARTERPDGVEPVPSGSADHVRHEGTLILSELYSADLDSLCPDWTVSDSSGSGHDLTNDGTGLARALSGAQLAVVEKDADATYAMCAANTDYVASTVYYDDIRVGDRYCVRTDEGRRTLITVMKLRRGDDRTSVQLRVRTWSRTEPRGEDDTDYSPLILVLILLLLSGGSAKAASSAKKTGKGSKGDRAARKG